MYYGSIVEKGGSGFQTLVRRVVVAGRDYMCLYIPWVIDTMKKMSGDVSLDILKD